jgi:uncharacterized protein YjlB
VVEPKQFVFKDDGVFPNSVLPVLIYFGLRIPETGKSKQEKDLASFLERRFAENDWTNSWRDGVYSFAHYHSTSHEVLGVYGGNAKLRLGGDKHGEIFEVQAGDVIVVPAGVAHQNLGSNSEFGVAGAYPGGRDWDLLHGLAGERPTADRNIEKLPLPENDPLYGSEGPLRKMWKR